MVAAGPSMPAWPAVEDPTRAMPIITMNIGSTVQKVPLNADSA
jgi:hypothetical protein